MQPREWCEPPSAFGDPSAAKRVWLPPSRPWLTDEFRAAVLHHAIAVSVRRYKNEHGVTQEALGRLDDRPDSVRKWNARLNGRVGLTLRDLAVLVRLLPGALPSEDAVRALLGVAEKSAEPPPGWDEVDS